MQGEPQDARTSSNISRRIKKVADRNRASLCYRTISGMSLRPSSTWGRYVLLLSASPDFNAVIRGPDVPIRMRFNTRIDSKNSKLVLFGPNGAAHELPVVHLGLPDMLVSAATGLTSGTYAIHWHVIEMGGNVAEGEVTFCVQNDG